jgi:hypothetical protein
MNLTAIQKLDNQGFLTFPQIELVFPRYTRKKLVQSSESFEKLTIIRHFSKTTKAIDSG